MTGPSTSVSLQGKRILVAEDDALVYMLLDEMLTELGCAIVGPATRVKDAIALAADGTLDGAILDINLGGTSSYAVADKLAERRIAFAFLTGYGADVVRAEYRERLILQKPISMAELTQAITDVVTQTAH